MSDELKMGDIFETKVKLFETITEWFIMHGVSFAQVKSNKMNYTAACAFIAEGDNAFRDVCSWTLHASAPKNSCGYFIIKNIYRSAYM